MLCLQEQSSNSFVSFIDQRLSGILHHRNHLKHYQSTLAIFKEHFKTIILYVDFSENLAVPVKYEPQSLHWRHQQITVHSGIGKVNGEKSYHPYQSNERTHDQHSVQLAISEMLRDVEINAGEYVIIESDNCASQYKSCAHFHGMQTIADSLNLNIIRVYGIAEHGKGEVDHVGGLAKTSLRRAIAAREFFTNAKYMVEF